MSKTYIQWSQWSWHVFKGCLKVSPGCKYCYMHRMMDKDNPSLVRLMPSKRLLEPYGLPAGTKVFVTPFSDLFIIDADPWRMPIWEVMKNCPDIIFQILTKRPERILQCLPPDWGTTGYKNVWLGVSIESQAYVDRMITLSQLDTPQRQFKFWISAEPLIDEIDFLATPQLATAFQKMAWVVAGGESGVAPEGTPGVKYCYRPTDSKWFDQIMKQCAQCNVPIFIKQLGNHAAKKLKLHDKKGGDINEWPSKYQIRMWP